MIMKRIKLIPTYKMQNTFTIDEIRKYILSQDSLGDVLYNLSVSKILEANEPEEDDEEDDEDDFDYIIDY
jgi:hypothetical protein